ncbi:MAG: hypothetical protein GY746_11120 [Gammaproteobacteria bacterium]|nr:hypothetical protein [Gammaproteobacteria bacterium]
MALDNPIEVEQTVEDFGGEVLDFSDLDNADYGNEVVDEAPEEEEAPKEEETPEEAPEEEAPKEEEAPEEETPEEDLDKKPVKNRIPIERLNQEIDKKKAVIKEKEELEARIQQLEQAQQTPAPQQTPPAPAVEPEVTFDPASEINEALELALDGDSEKAASAIANVVNEAVNKAQQDIMSQLDQRSTLQNQQQTEMDHATQVANQFVADYAELDENSDSFDKGMLDEIIETRDMFKKSGMSLGGALTKAAALHVKANGYEKKGTQPARDENAIADAKAKQAEKTAKKAESLGKQPGRVEGNPAPDNDFAVNIANMSEADFDKLTDAELAAARGDY